ncbi:hypothetical protein OG453_23605 [Streptomyces sp. NBC_01381]|uniref:hypothetical protein n=1 Tax=Streptomyces sp. NBC_01381 TaxID=2903845 RepID=UPI0022503C0A|nr:hypothetical protein [Streptomyces sp. NBC_01381]MCX4669633.1 hypothetical protein [Streptomyces sp. NBC_01381]
MPRRGQHTPATPVAAHGTQPPAVIGPRVVHVPQHNRSGTRAFRITPADFRCTRLVSELADEWASLAELRQWRSAAVDTHLRTIKLFAGFVDTHAASPEAASLARDVPDLAHLVREHSRLLPAQYATGSETPALLIDNLRALMNAHAQREEVSVAEGLLRLLAAPHSVPYGKSSELDEFSRKEKGALLRAAWAGVREAENRLARGRELVAQGGPPAAHGWTDIANLLWAVQVGGFTWRELARSLPPLSTWTQEMRELASSRAGAVRPDSARSQFCTGLLTYLHVTQDDMHAFRILIMAATGHAPEEITGLGESDVEFTSLGVRVTLRKRRARKLRTREFHAPRTATHPDSGQLNAAELLRRLISVTAQTRELAGAEDADRLFLVATLPRSREPQIRPFNPNLPNGSFSGWGTRQGLDISQPRDIRRLRKSGKVEKAIAHHGAVDRIADDHTRQTYLDHYARGTTLRVVSGQLVTQAQREWFDTAVTGPVVLDEAAEASFNAPEALAALDLSRDQADQIRDGALNMGVSECRDPYDSPYAKKPGELCPAAPLSCLECKNAFILPSNLPQLLLYGDFLDQLTHRLTPPVFDARWGQRQTNLRAALAERTSDEITAARKQIEDQSLTLQIPLSSHTEFDR